MKLKPDKDALFNKLCSDCITYGLKPAEEIEYVSTEMNMKGRDGKMRRFSISAINDRKMKLQSDEDTQTWLNRFTRIGFIQLQKEQEENIKKVLDNTYRWYFEELIKPNKSASLLIRLQREIRETTALLINIGLGTPILAETRERIRRQEKERASKIPAE